MKCLLCSNELDESKPVEPADSVSARQQRANELSQWAHVALTTTRNGGQYTILQGFFCPTHAESNDVVLSVKKGK